MINKKTIIILGAGSSKPFGYPTGKELSISFPNSVWEREKSETPVGDFGHANIEKTTTILSFRLEPVPDLFRYAGILNFTLLIS